MKHVELQTEAIGRGDAKSGNKHAKQYIRAWEVLRSIGDPEREALAPLMHHARGDVRGAAAACLMRYRPDEACSELGDLALGEGMVAFEADETLKRWKEGTWQLDPP